MFDRKLYFEIYSFHLNGFCCIFLFSNDNLIIAHQPRAILFSYILLFFLFLYLPKHCVKSARIWVFSGPHFPAFKLNTERYGVQSECGKIRTRITPNMETFYAVKGS